LLFVVSKYTVHGEGAVAAAPGGLEGLQPSKDVLFSVVFAGFAGKHHQK